MSDHLSIHADNLSEREVYKFWPEPETFISAFMGYCLCPFRIVSQATMEKYKFDDLLFCDEPAAVLTEKELDRWNDSREPEDAPSLWQGTLWRHPKAVGDALDRLADRVEAKDPEFDEFVNLVYEARHDCEEEELQPPSTDEEWEKFRDEHRPIAVETFRKFANFCRKLAELGATKIVGMTYF